MSDFDDYSSEYKAGLNIRQIAELHHVSYETVRKTLKDKVSWRKKYVSDFEEPEIKKAVQMFDDGYTVKHIAKWFEISPPAMTRLLRANNRTPVASEYKYEILRATPISFIQKQFLVGHLLGDGCMYKDGPNSMYKVNVAQQKKHEQYFHWKIAMLDPFVNTWRESIDKRENSVMLQATSICHPDFKFFAEKFYDVQRKKHVPKDIDMFMTPLSLAVWIMDDGSLNSGVNLRIASHGFTEEENYRLQNLLRSVFDIRSKVMEARFKGKLYYSLSINKENTIKTSNIIRPHVVDCMKYKLISLESSTTNTPTPEKG